MPKKNWGMHSKAAEAHARETAKKKTAAEKKQQEAEDEYWRDDDKHSQKKLNRKAEKQQKHEDDVKRKQDLKKLLEEEEGQLAAKSKPKPASARPTRAQVESAREKAVAEEFKRLGITSSSQTQKAASEPTAVSVTRNDETQDSEDDMLAIEENVNKLVSVNVGDGSARNVDEALVLLGDQEEVDAHPEKRMKKAHKEFEEAALARLKAENPNMRLSQLKQMAWREWLRAPQNPLNMAANKPTS